MGRHLPALYIGAFAGPFAGQALFVVLPELAQAFSVTTNQAALAPSAYMIPYSLLMLISSKLTARYSPSTISGYAFALILVVSTAISLAHSWSLFLILYGVLGAANAFTTPLLQVILNEVTPFRNRGRALGTYAAFQSFGSFIAPAFAGLAIQFSWRWIFALLGILAINVLLLRIPRIARIRSTPRQHGSSDAGPGRIVSTVIVLSWVSFGIGFGVLGLVPLLSLQLVSGFGLQPGARGALVMLGGLGAFASSRYLGMWADRLGVKKVLPLGLAAVTLGIVGVSLAPSPWVTACAWVFSVIAAQMTQVGANVAILNERNGSHYLSTVQAFRYLGMATAPAVTLAVAGESLPGAFGLVGALLAVTWCVSAAWSFSRPRKTTS